MEAIAAVRASGGPWTLSENASSVLEKIVCIYDVQLSGISGGLFTDATLSWNSSLACW
jgi:hypothetical protein